MAEEQFTIPDEARTWSDEQLQQYINQCINDDIESMSDAAQTLYSWCVDQLCQHDDVLALEYMAYACYGWGQFPFETDWVKSRDCLLRLMELDPQARYANTLGYIYYYGRCTDGAPDYDNAFRYFSIGAAGGIVESQYKLADMLLAGKGIPACPGIADQMYWDVYKDTFGWVIDQRFDTPFADAALRVGGVLQRHATSQEDWDNAFKTYLQAYYAIRQRMDAENPYGDTKVLRNIENGIRETLPHTSYQKPRRTVHYSFLSEILLDAAEQRHAMSLRLQSIDEDIYRLTIDTIPREDDETPPELFITEPKAWYCGHRRQITVTLRYPELLNVEVAQNPLWFNEVDGPNLYLCGNRVAAIAGDMILHYPASHLLDEVFTAPEA